MRDRSQCETGVGARPESGREESFVPDRTLPADCRVSRTSDGKSGDQVQRRPESAVERTTRSQRNRVGPRPAGLNFGGDGDLGLGLRINAAGAVGIAIVVRVVRLRSELVGSDSKRPPSRPAWPRRLAAFGTSTRPNCSSWRYWTLANCPFRWGLCNSSVTFMNSCVG